MKKRYVGCAIIQFEVEFSVIVNMNLIHELRVNILSFFKTEIGIWIIQTVAYEWL